MHTAAQRERSQLQGAPAGLVSCRPGASGETSRTQRSVTAPKAAGDKQFYPLQFGWYHGAVLHSLVPFGMGLFFVFAPAREKVKVDWIRILFLSGMWDES